MAKDPAQYLEDLIYNTVSCNVAEIFRRLSAKKNDIISREEALCLAEGRLRSVDKDYWI